MIEIASHLRPFSHLPGTRCLIPTTSYLVEAFPALIRIVKFSGEIIKEIPLSIQGPLKTFTVMQDLEKGCVTIFSEKYRFHLLPNLEMTSVKNPPSLPLMSKERLSLGSHKKQDWEMIKKRRDFFLILPIWLRLGSSLSLPSRSGDERGVFRLLKECQEVTLKHRPEAIFPALEKLFLAGFESLMIPREKDREYQGILSDQESPSDDSPLYLLAEGAQWIRSLFFRLSGNQIFVLPNLPPQFFAGRMTEVDCSPFGKFNLEWSKKKVRQFHFYATLTGEVTFHFPPDMESCRLRFGSQDRGRILTCGDSLAIKSGSHYLLDRFQK